jgi:hypothetical protein
VGFTTKEAEMVVNHPVRRRIIRDLILAGNVGLTSALAALVVSMMQTEKSSQMLMMVLGVSVAVVLLLSLSRVGWLQRLLDRMIHRALEHAGMVRALDYETAAAHPAWLCGLGDRGAAGKLSGRKDAG